MNMFWLVVLVLVNTGISIWNAYACGAYWTESKVIGGWIRFMVWCGVIMSACGFSWVYLFGVALVGVKYGFLSMHHAEIMLKLGYLIIIPFVLIAGTAIWIQSVIQAYRTRNFGDMAVAGWNTFAHFHNTWEAASNAPSAFGDVKDFFSGDSDDNAKGLVGLLVVLVLIAGILTTAAIVRWADRRVALDVVAARA